MPHFKQLLDKHKSVVVETAKFIKLPEEVGTSFCTKGVVVIGSSNGVVLVCELVIEHPGTLISGIGVNMGLHYRWQESRLERATNDDDCPCGNVLRHDHHLGVLESIEWALANRRVRRVSKLSLEVRE